MKKRIGLKIFLALLLIVLIVVGFFTYQTKYRKTEILSSSSSNGAYTLTIYAIGEPDFPFGACHCRFVLKAGSKLLLKENFDIHNDGAWASTGNFQIKWRDESVVVIASASEQDDVYYILDFNGKMESFDKEEAKKYAGID